jgi:acyl-coenzyme A synthetase/AMP-(fatty) acid ligase/nucleoside-diphosphate-sugar epimerase/aryl carrier-like protein
MTGRWQPPWLHKRHTARLRPWQQGLAAAGVCENHRVGIYLSRCEAWVEVALAVWSLGAVVVPLDPAWPVARCEEVARRARLIAVAGRPLGSWPRVGKSPGPALVQADFDAERTAWICFTSGSTGRPKGVEVRWAGVPGLIEAQRVGFGIEPGDRVGWALSPGFDASFSDVLTALDAGGFPVCAPPGLLQTPGAVWRWIERHQLACVDLPPALLPYLSDQTPPGCLRTVVVGGEVSHAGALCALARKLRVVSVYGPTEATVCTHLAPVDADSWTEGELGLPLDGVSDAVVEEGQLVADGEPGELWVGGTCLARGYLGHEETERRFVFADLGAGRQRWYRTGDRVVRNGHSLLFLGRTDRVVKLRGRLVALAEVETVLRGLPGVFDVSVVQVAGRLQAVMEGAAMPSDWREHAAARLPRWMVPVELHHWPALPRTVSAKVDHTQVAAALQTENVHSAAATVGEQVARTWSEVLGRPVRPEDDLTAAGRDSVSVLEVQARLQHLGLFRTLGQLASAPTPLAMVGPQLTLFPISSLESEVVRRSTPVVRSVRPRGSHLLWLGATGFLGSWTLSRWCNHDRRRPVLAVVRGQTPARARARLADALAAVGGRHALQWLTDGRIEVIPGDLSEPRLGLADVDYASLVRRTGALVDLAGHVSLGASLPTLLAANAAPVHRLAALAGEAGGVPVLHTSTLSLFVEGWPRVPRLVLDGTHRPDSGSLSGAYAASKWVAEALWDRIAPGPLRVLRPGLVVGDTRTGAMPPLVQLSGVLRSLVENGVPDGVPPTAAVNLTPVDLGANRASRAGGPRGASPQRHLG